MAAQQVSPVEQALAGIGPDDYGPEHAAHVLALYQAFLQTAENTVDRRQRANVFFLSIHTALVAFVGFSSHVVVYFAGLIACFAWFRYLRHASGLNRGKLRVLTAFETLMPARPFHAEWEALEEGRNRSLYRPLGRAELWVPMAFGALYLAVLVEGFAVPWVKDLLW